MEYRVLGETKLTISRLGLGGIPLQHLSRAEVRSLLSTAMDEGINFIDTARGYSVSEEYIGYGLKGNRQNWIIASKSMARTKTGIIDEIHKSLKTMGTDYLDLYQAHNVRTESEWQQIIAEDGALEGLREAKEAGLIRCIGITAHSVEAMHTALTSNLFATMMLPYNIIESDNKYLFEIASEHNTGTFAMKPLAGGFIADAEKALRYLAADRTVDCLLAGMDSPAEIKANARALEMGPLSTDEENELAAFARTLGQDFCRRCGYCQPCPEGIDIPTILLLESYYDRYELQTWARDRYASIPVPASACAHCKDCEAKCPYDLQIPDKLARAAAKLASER